MYKTHLFHQQASQAKEKPLKILPLTMSNSTKSFKFRISIKTSTSATLISTNDDLLTEILVRLPVRSLLRFKSVSKHWRSLITSQHIRDHPSRRKIISASGLFLHRSSSLVNPEHDFISFDHETQITKPPFKTLSFVHDSFGIKILQSCNGLLLCSTFRAPPVYRKYYIYNPTTTQSTTLPHSTIPGFSHTAKVQSLRSVNLAFDPSISSHYKVVYVYLSDTSPEHYEIEIYSSETGLWRTSGQPFLADVSFMSGTFWNGAIHWLGAWLGASSLYFDVNSEQLGVMPMPLTLSRDNEEDNGLIIVKESRDHLHLTQIIDLPTTKFNVYEMERDYSGWFLKYKVDLGCVLNAFPEMICSYLGPTDFNYYKYAVESVVREENEEESFMVLLIPGKMIRYKFADRSFKKLCEIEADSLYGDEGFLQCTQCRWFDPFQFIESLAGV